MERLPKKRRESEKRRAKQGSRETRAGRAGLGGGGPAQRSGGEGCWKGPSEEDECPSQVRQHGGHGGPPPGQCDRAVQVEAPREWIQECLTVTTACREAEEWGGTWLLSQVGLSTRSATNLFQLSSQVFMAAFFSLADRALYSIEFMASCLRVLKSAIAPPMPMKAS